MLSSNKPTTISRFLDVPVSDPEDARRRRLLNVILAGAFVSSVAVLLTSIVFTGLGWITLTRQEGIIIIGSAAAVIVGSSIIYIVNRRVSGTLASGLFLSLLMLVLPFADTTHELVNGRSLFLFVIPIFISAALLGSAASFIFYLLSAAEMTILALIIGEPPNTIAIVTIFILALLSWLSARSLEQALRELRTINIDLDRRVEDRTRELSEALARELIEAGKNQAILEGIADGVIVFDTQGKSIVANPSLSRLLEIPAPDLLGTTLENILQVGKAAPQDRGTILGMLHQPQKDMPSVRFRWGDRTLLVNAALVKTDLGDAIGTVAVFRDFTREAEVEQMKNTFVAMVSHELRTPLNAILGFAEMIREAVYGPITARQAGVVERIENSSRRLLSLVSDLLDQAQIEAGRMKIHIAEFQVSDLMDSLRVALDKQAAEKGLTLTTKIEPGMPSVALGDFNRLQQILLNLGGNAVKFTESGGVTVRIYRVDERYWGFDVTDTGPGISAEARGYIFESFRQVEDVVIREHGGIGLGLAIVKSLVELMGGQILLASEVGKGATFTVTFPFEPSKEKTK